MTQYAKITTEQQLHYMPNLYKVVVSNPNEQMKAQLATMFDWLEVVNTEEPKYDTETQYIISHYENINGKAVQVWEVKEIETESEQGK